VGADGADVFQTFPEEGKHIGAIISASTSLFFFDLFC
jgi:hypothetical protein